MTKSKKILYYLTVTLLALTFAVCSLLCVPGIASFLGVKSKTLFSDSFNVTTFGDTFEVPEHSIKVDGKDYPATAIVTLPDGNVTTASQITLNVAGKYNVNYSVTVDGREYTEDYSFTVNYPLATGVESSAMKYGSLELAPKDPGLIVEVKDGETLTFTKTIDLSNAKKGEYFTEFYPAPKLNGAADASQFWITLTDVEDPESYIIMRANNITSGTMDSAYFLIKGDGQSAMVGYEPSWDRLHKDNEYGAWHALSLSGMRGGYYDNTGVLNTLRISYDSAEKVFWLTTSWGANTAIADLDDATQFGDSLWKGFTSGKVRMSFYCKSYLSDSARYVFKQVGNMNLFAGSFADNNAPELTVGNPEYNAVVNCAYTLPKATTTDDLSPVTSVDMTVVKDGVTVPVVDGKFTPTTVGTYSVTYTACDSFGNKSERTITVVCDANAEEVTLNAPEKMIETANRGEKIILPMPVATGGVGDVKVTVYINNVAIDGNVFIPMETGSYDVAYVAEDAVGQKQALTYTVNVSNGSQPVFRDEPNLPKLYLSGFSYHDPKLYAYDYSSGQEVKVEAKLSVTDASGTRALSFGGGFVPVIFDNGEEITLTWKAGETTLERKVKAVFPLSNEGIIIENYFLTDGIGFTPASGNIEIVAEEENGSWTYALELIAEGFSLELTALPKKSNFDKLTLTLTDSLNSNISVTMTMESADEGRTIIRSGKRYGIVSNGFANDSASNKMMLSFNNNSIGIGTAMLAVDYDDNGAEFNGFPSGTVYATLAFEGAETGSAYLINSLCEQTMGILASDRIRPLIFIKGNYGGSAKLGDVITVPSMVARDVLNPSLVTYVTVKDVNGNFIVADDGTVLQKAKCDVEYTFKATAYGEYQFEYVAEDSLSGRVRQVPFVLSVPDAEAPTVTPQTPMPTTLKVGDVIVIPNLDVSDNISTEENILVTYCIISPTGKIIYLPEGSNSLQTSHVGVYEIRILVYDEAGNITMLQQNVNVTAE